MRFLTFASVHLRTALAGVSGLVAVLALAGCGGSSSDSIEFNFDDLPPEEPAASVPVPTIDPFGRIAEVSARVGRLEYLHDLAAMAQEMEANRRVMLRLVEDAQSEGADTDWVVDVHGEHRKSEELRIRAYGYSLPADLAADYLSFHAAFLEAVQVYAFGADRLLAGSILVGPSGRGSDSLTAAEHSDFKSLLGECQYYMLDSEVLIGRVNDDLQEILRSLRVR